MPRSRIIYQNQGLFVGPTGALPSGVSLTGIQRVQSITHNAAINRQTVNQFGQLSQIDRVILQPPTVSLSFESLLVNAVNANRLGFVTDGSVSCIANIISGKTDIYNYYVGIAADGSDLIGTTGAGCFTFGNGFISNVEFQGAVGDFPKESYTVDALNYRVYSLSSGNVPSVDPKTGLEPNTATFVLPVASSGTVTSKTAIQPGDISLALTDTVGLSASDLHIQNFKIAIPLARQDLTQLGTRFAYAKVIQFPVTVTATFSAIVGDIQSSGIADRLCTDNPVNLTVTLREPNCQGTGNVAVQYTLKGCKLDSTSYNAAIGGQATADFSYSTLIGGANDTTVGVFISGISS